MCKHTQDEAVAAAAAHRPAVAQTVAGQPSPVQLAAVESLAAWRGVIPTAMALTIAAMTASQRDELRQEFAEVHQHVEDYSLV